MKKLAEFLRSITQENSQFCESKGYVTRFLDINTKIRSLTDDIISKSITNGICRVYEHLEDTDNITDLLTYLFYDIILLQHSNKFQSANQVIINQKQPFIPTPGLYNFCLHSNDLWARVTIEYYNYNKSLYDNINFPQRGNTIIGYDSNDMSYPIMSGQLWYILTNNFGSTDQNNPTLIIPCKFLNNYKSSWKVNHEMSMNCTAASHRDSGVFLDFESGINKITPYNFKLLSRNDLTAIGTCPINHWTMLKDDKIKCELLSDKCNMSIEIKTAYDIYTAKSRLEWFCRLLFC